MKKIILFVFMVILAMNANAQSTTKPPFIGSRYFNYSGGGMCCFAKITISKNGNCVITGKGVDDTDFIHPMFSGKYNKVVWTYENKKKIEGYKIEKNYITFLKPNGKTEVGCDEENKPCKFDLKPKVIIYDFKGKVIYSDPKI